FKKMVNRYKWLKIKYEYSEDRHVYLVSYSPIGKIEKNEDFMKESIDFENEISLLYENYAPLFCDEESLFKLSQNAELIQYSDYVDVPIKTVDEKEKPSRVYTNPWQSEKLENIDYKVSEDMQ
ncbi:MAG: hypothetical protein LUD48_07515, partial [Prevotella sp.]|nr:hypothetical protein [Prevotella sp.]